MASHVTCLSCKEALTAEEFVNACTSWFAAVDCVNFNCPRCSKRGEARLETGCLTHGYVGFGGGPYFSEQIPVPLPQLVVERTAEGLKLTLDQSSRTLPRA